MLGWWNKAEVVGWCLSISNLSPHNDWNVLKEATLGYMLQHNLLCYKHILEASLGFMLFLSVALVILNKVMGMK